jgi:hypothetical protein
MECGICYEESGEKITLKCDERCENHYYHPQCIERWFRVKGEKRCPYCTKNVEYEMNMERSDFTKWAIRSYTREQVHRIVNAEFKKITVGYIYYSMMFMIYITSGFNHHLLEWYHCPLLSTYMFVLERNQKISEFMVDKNFFLGISFQIFYMIYLLSLPSSSEFWKLYLFFDVGIYIYTLTRLLKIWNHYHFEQPSYILLDNIHISVRENIHDHQWVDY